tara:strand:+ start:121 stop:894 length:774 start_codon:yes stop_codon:yes gene_type:complete
MKKLLNEWRQFLKESDVDPRDIATQIGQENQNLRDRIEAAMEREGVDWILEDIPEWSLIATPTSEGDRQQMIDDMDEILAAYGSPSVKELLMTNESVEKEISKTLSDEGGAAGFDPLHKAAKKVEKKISKKEVEDIIKKMDNVYKHRDGDYIKEGEYDRGTIRKMVEEEIEKLNEKPTKGKAKTHTTASGKKVSYGQAGKAKGGGPRVKPGTSKGDSYCARSLGIKKGLSKKKQNDPNTPNNLSRKRWKCKGAKSTK